MRSVSPRRCYPRMKPRPFCMKEWPPRECFAACAVDEDSGRVRLYAQRKVDGEIVESIDETAQLMNMLGRESDRGRETVASFVAALRAKTGELLQRDAERLQRSATLRADRDKMSHALPAHEAAVDPVRAAAIEAARAAAVAAISAFAGREGTLAWAKPVASRRDGTTELLLLPGGGAPVTSQSPGSLPKAQYSALEAGLHALMPAAEALSGEAMFDASGAPLAGTDERGCFAVVVQSLRLPAPGTARPERPAVMVSRTDSRLVARLMEREVPTVAAGLVEVKAAARIPGLCAKAVVAATTKGLSKGARRPEAHASAQPPPPRCLPQTLPASVLPVC